MLLKKFDLSLRQRNCCYRINHAWSVDDLAQNMYNITVRIIRLIDNWMPSDKVSVGQILIMVESFRH